MNTVLIVTTTLATREQAQMLARSIVGQRLAACAQIDAIESIYHWQGQVQQEAEFRVSFKTLPAYRAALEAAIQAEHPYELPQVLAVEAEASATYAAWVRSNVA
jgi:periplasmic divalent cation tolerance protein